MVYIFEFLYDYMIHHYLNAISFSLVKIAPARGNYYL